MEDRDEMIQRYLSSKFGPQPEEDLDSLRNKQNYNIQLQRDAASANLMSGLNNASALISGGRYKADNSDLDASNKDRQNQIIANNQQMADGQQQASKERQSAISEYLAGKKQDQNMAFQKDVEKRRSEHDMKMQKLAQSNADAKNQWQSDKLALQQQIAEAKVANAGNKLPHEQQKMVDTLADTAAKRVSTSNILEERLKKYRAAIAANNTDEAVKEGQQMLKLLNSPDNPDAVGAEEAKRLGSFLEKKVFNLMQPGSMFGRDLDQFDTQVANSVNLIRDSAKTNLSQVDDIKSGKGFNLNPVETMPKTGGFGTATAAPSEKDINLMSEEELLKELGN